MSLKYKDGQSMSDHLNEFQGVIDQLSARNVKFEDELQGLWLLGTLPDSWETFRMSLTLLLMVLSPWSLLRVVFE